MMRRLLGGSKADNATGSQSTFDEVHALQDALTSASLIMNDEVDEAEKRLSQGKSPFHQLGVAVTFFLRATLGLEKDVIESAKARLEEAEQAALSHHRSATRDPSATRPSAVYSAGSQYALCHAECQLMLAVLAVLNESLTESLKGFYRLRKAFNTLYELVDQEKKYLALQHRDDDVSKASSTKSQARDECASFRGSEEHKPVPVVPTDRESLLNNHSRSLSVVEASSSIDIGQPRTETHRSASSSSDEGSIDLYTSDPIELFVHAGTNLCFGLLQLLLAMIPPSFAKILNLFSFRGDRDEGIARLWTATRFKSDINGALAGLIILGYHSTVLDACDILPTDMVPESRLRCLLEDMRRLYPKSKLWIVEEAKMLSGREQQLEKAVDILDSSKHSSLRQIDAMAMFEKALNLLYLHKYQECAEAFITCVGLNSWSHALYYYVAGTCYVELYRMHQSSDSEKAEAYAKQAEKYLHEVPARMSKKRPMGRQLPINVFVSRKITKWESRARSMSCRLVDAVGVSPAVEMTYFWSGFRKMRAEHLQICLERLSWSSDQVDDAAWQKEAADEKCIALFLKAVCQRFLGDIAGSRTTFTDGVLVHDLSTLKACGHADVWTLPTAHYELAVCSWRDAPEPKRDSPLLAQCNEELSRVENWESYEMEARLGMKVAMAQQTLRRNNAVP